MNIDRRLLISFIEVIFLLSVIADSNEIQHTGVFDHAKSEFATYKGVVSSTNSNVLKNFLN